MVALILALALYTSSAVLYLLHLVVSRQQVARWASRTLQGAFLVHALVLPFWFAELGPEGLVGLLGLLPVVAWLVAATYLVLEARFRIPILGIVVAPLLSVALLACVLGLSGARPVPSALQGALLTAHVVGAVLGLGAFSLAAGLSGLYLLQLRQLKRKSFGRLYHRLPPLDTLDRLALRCTTVGFPLYTLSVVLGAVRTYQGGGFGNMGQASLLAALSWLLYGMVLVARPLLGWRGRRSALLILAGCCAAAAVLLLLVLS